MRKIIKKVVLPIIESTPIYSYWRKRQDENWRLRILDDLKKRKDVNVYNRPIIDVVNFNANDICNSRCVMCNIWKQKKTYEVTPEDLKKILKDALYQEVKHIGITGGEPTLRKDLALLYQAIFETLPNIEGASIITNCIRSEDVIARVEEVLAVCAQYNKEFSMMVSLDGVGPVHENVRRIKGNFDSAIKVLTHFKNKGINITTGTTISKVNVWEVDELLDFFKENDIHGRFRIAEFINRLYNNDNSDIIRNFDEDEKYHLILFFYKLILNYEKNGTYQRTYKSIINILAGGDRLISCPYRTNGVVLNSRGDLSYCAPKSEVLGNAIEESSYALYRENLSEKERIFKEDCSNCIHDYHAPLSYDEKVKEFDEVRWRLKLSFEPDCSLSYFNRIKAKRNKQDNKQFFITGWYGTETVGDKAILGQVINELYNEYGDNIEIIVTSLFPIITERTIRELKTNKVRVVFVYSEDFVSYIKGSDAVLIGGGPLMDLEELSIPLNAFRIARYYRKKTIIKGCGLGPLYYPKYQRAVKEILQLSDVIELRDYKSVEQAKKWLANHDHISMIGDPAKKYLSQYKLNTPLPKTNKIMTCFLRELTSEYAKESLQEFDLLKIKFEKQLSGFLKEKALELGVDEIRLEHMHNFECGNDDRDFSRRFIREYFSDFSIPISYNKRLSTVESIVESMQQSSFNVCMRFHSVVFAHTLETRFCAIDYTRGGKIFNYLQDNNCSENLVSILDIIKE